MLNSIRDGLPPHSLPIYIIFRNKLPKWPDVFYFYDLSRILRLITDHYLIRPSAFDLLHIRGCPKTFRTLPLPDKTHPVYGCSGEYITRMNQQRCLWKQLTICCAGWIDSAAPRLLMSRHWLIDINDVRMIAKYEGNSMVFLPRWCVIVAWNIDRFTVEK